MIQYHTGLKDILIWSKKPAHKYINSIVDMLI